MRVLAAVLSLLRPGSALAALFLCFVITAQAAETFERDTLTVITRDGERHDFIVELAVTPRQREQGLMNRHEMAPDHGMLFAFGQTRQVLMWMKNTYLSLDMLFIDGEGRIRTIKENAEPQSEAIIDSKVPVDFVLELNAGTAKRLGIRVGNRVENGLIDTLKKAE